MKKLSIIFLLLMVLGLTVSSCSNDDKNEVTIEGKWEFYQEGTIIGGKEILTDIPSSSSKCGKDYLEFVKGGLLNDFSFGESDADCTKPIETAAWVKTDNTLNVKYTRDPAVDYEILELSNSILKLKEIDEEGVYLLVFKRK